MKRPIRGVKPLFLCSWFARGLSLSALFCPEREIAGVEIFGTVAFISYGSRSDSGEQEDKDD